MLLTIGFLVSSYHIINQLFIFSTWQKISKHI